MALSEYPLRIYYMTRYGLDDRGSIHRRGENFFFGTTPRLAVLPTKPSVQLVPSAVSPGINIPEREARHAAGPKW
jgi:hypothetical protein